VRTASAAAPSVISGASELSDPPAVITKYWCLLDAIGHAKPIITDGKRVSSGYMGGPSDVVD
jgi:hypothetical protein